MLTLWVYVIPSVVQILSYSHILCGCFPLVHIPLFLPFFCCSSPSQSTIPPLIFYLFLQSNQIHQFIYWYWREAARSQSHHMIYSIVPSYSSLLSVQFSLLTLALCVSAAYCTNVCVLLCACSYLEVKDGRSRRSGVLIELQKCTVIIMKALQEKLNLRRRKCYETWRFIFI